MLLDLKASINKYANPIRAKHSLRFFKTGPGEYGQGDEFLGLNVPQQRSVVKKYKDLSLLDIQNLLDSKYHEYRLVGLLILVSKKLDKEIYDLYLKNTARINNWDLVDLTAPHIVGKYLLDKKRDILYRLVKSKLLWDRRIAVLATFTFIKNKDYTDSLQIAEMLLSDEEDLMHKAVGWMLREIGKRDVKVLECFLEKNISKMPRTCLRYAIEKFPEEKRQYYLKK
ncbi:DNA alkylation repair protein [Candidatus Microgenomates bacterium]|nr:DNA alkylation repair protein [Candidatus Microgenomates bacterium]